MNMPLVELNTHLAAGTAQCIVLPTQRRGEWLDSSFTRRWGTNTLLALTVVPVATALRLVRVRTESVSRCVHHRRTKLCRTWANSQSNLRLCTRTMTGGCQTRVRQRMRRQRCNHQRKAVVVAVGSGEPTITDPPFNHITTPAYRFPLR